VVPWGKNSAAKKFYIQSLATTDLSEKPKLRDEIISLDPDSHYGLFARDYLPGVMPIPKKII
jgi:hypothetical protein